MKVAKIKYNDIVDGNGICVSLWAQGCPHHCPGCHNPETWNPEGGKFVRYEELAQELSKALLKNNIHRNFSILGGEPLAPYNIETINLLGYYVKLNHPTTKIYLWTGYTLEELKEKGNEYIKCFDWADVIIEGRYIQELRDITLELRGSSNQRILYKGKDF